MGAILELDPSMGERGGERSGTIVPSRKRIGTRRAETRLPGNDSMD